MKRVNKKAAEYVTPDVEISVRAGTQELAAIAFYAAEAGQWDVLVGVLSPSSRSNLASVLRWASDAVEQAAYPLDDPTGDADDGDKRAGLENLPF